MNHEHWFDRLSANLTRRQIMKAALGSSAALAVPMVRSTIARADGASPCVKGCTWTAAQHLQGREQICIENGFQSLFQVLIFASAFGPVATLAGIACKDAAYMIYKSDWYDCMQGTDCGGFDPTQKGGPCDGCTANCCTCSASTNGYICCIFLCDDGDHNCCPGG